MRLRGAAEGDEADHEQSRRGRRHIEGQHLHDQRRADVGAEHDGQCRHQPDHALGGERRCHQRGRGAALQQRGQAETGGKRRKAVAERLRQHERRSEPNARRMPLWTMCRPQSSSATPPIRSRITMVPIGAPYSPGTPVPIQMLRRAPWHAPSAPVTALVVLSRGAQAAKIAMEEGPHVMTPSTAWLVFRVLRFGSGWQPALLLYVHPEPGGLPDAVRHLMTRTELWMFGFRWRRSSSGSWN